MFVCFRFQSVLVLDVSSRLHQNHFLYSNGVSNCSRWQKQSIARPLHTTYIIPLFNCWSIMRDYRSSSMAFKHPDATHGGNFIRLSQIRSPSVMLDSFCCTISGLMFVCATAVELCRIQIVFSLHKNNNKNPMNMLLLRTCTKIVHRPSNLHCSILNYFTFRVQNHDDLHRYDLITAFTS